MYLENIMLPLVLLVPLVPLVLLAVFSPFSPFEGEGERTLNVAVTLKLK